jgi:UDP-glucuronate 4-epimerase
MQRVLITGAAGFIGSHACEAFAAAGYDTIGLDNFDPYYDRATKQTNVRVLEAAGAHFREADVRDDEALASLFDVVKPDVVVHLAAKAGVRNSEKFPAEYVRTNVNGTQSVLDAARRTDVGRLVMASTSSVYGSASAIPFVEDDPAAASKRAAEILAGTYCSLYGLQVTVTRLFTVYGPRGRPDMMPYMLAKSCRDGTPVPLFEGPLARDWTYVGDIVAGLIQAAENPLGFEILNLGRGEPVPLSDFIDEMTRASGSAPALEQRERPGTELLTTFADSSKARERIGFAPAVSVPEGVARFWDWFASQ